MLESSFLPVKAAITWPRMSLVKEVTMALNAAPIMTATARSTTLPRRMKSRKPLSTVSLHVMRLQVVRRGVRVGSVYQRAPLVRRREPHRIGIEQEDQDQGHRHQVHIEAE